MQMRERHEDRDRTGNAIIEKERKGMTGTQRASNKTIKDKKGHEKISKDRTGRQQKGQ